MDLVTSIINEWDPIGFFPMAPQDEYSNEIKKIYDLVFNEQELQVYSLAQAINKIFVETFGRDVYEEDMAQCVIVAKKILEDKV